MAFWLKRVGLFFLVNMLVVLTISLISSLILGVFKVEPNAIGFLIVPCLVWGMGGALISLAISRMTAKWFMGVKVIPPDTQDPELRALVQMVHDLSKTAQLPAMPEVGIYESSEINAFATGPSRSRSLVAVSTGLLHQMQSGEIKGVLAHEVSHIANGDMVTMTLLQGVVNAFVMFLARAFAFAITRSQNGERGSSPSYLYPLVTFVLEIVFMIFGSMLVAWFSRHREYKADAGGASLAGRENMIRALECLRHHFESKKSLEPFAPASAQASIQTLKISSRPGGLMSLFSTHPPLEERINRLRTLQR